MCSPHLTFDQVRYAQLARHLLQGIASLQKRRDGCAPRKSDILDIAKTRRKLIDDALAQEKLAADLIVLMERQDRNAAARTALPIRFALPDLKSSFEASGRLRIIAGVQP